MRINIIWIPVEKNRILRDRILIERIISRHMRRAAKLLRINRKVLTITLHPHWWGWGGSTESKEWIRLKVPLRWKSRKHQTEFLKQSLPATIYHEMHHIARRYVYSPEKDYPGETLLVALIAEGLATAFSEEQVHGYRAKYGTYKSSFVRKWLPAVRKEKSSRTYDYWSWFHGKGKPRWLGYRIGKYIIDQIKERHPDLTAQKLVRTPTAKVLRLSKIKI